MLSSRLHQNPKAEKQNSRRQIYSRFNDDEIEE